LDARHRVCFGKHQFIIALNLLRHEPSRASIKMKRFRAALDTNYVLKILQASDAIALGWRVELMRSHLHRDGATNSAPIRGLGVESRMYPTLFAARRLQPLAGGGHPCQPLPAPRADLVIDKTPIACGIVPPSIQFVLVGCGLSIADVLFALCYRGGVMRSVIRVLALVMLMSSMPTAAYSTSGSNEIRTSVPPLQLTPFDKVVPQSQVAVDLERVPVAQAPQTRRFQCLHWSCTQHPQR
jgi:hypothetical protein